MERKKLEDEKEIERKKAENYEMYLRKLSIDKKEEKKKKPYSEQNNVEDARIRN